jgi:hypothetical protein
MVNTSLITYMTKTKIVKADTWMLNIHFGESQLSIHMDTEKELDGTFSEIGAISNES